MLFNIYVSFKEVWRSSLSSLVSVLDGLVAVLLVDFEQVNECLRFMPSFFLVSKIVWVSSLPEADNLFTLRLGLDSKYLNKINRN